MAAGAAQAAAGLVRKTTTGLFADEIAGVHPKGIAQRGAHRETNIYFFRSWRKFVQGSFERSYPGRERLRAAIGDCDESRRTGEAGQPGTPDQLPMGRLFLKLARSGRSCLRAAPD